MNALAAPPHSPRAHRRASCRAIHGFTAPPESSLSDGVRNGPAIAPPNILNVVWWCREEEPCACWSRHPLTHTCAQRLLDPVNGEQLSADQLIEVKSKLTH